MPGGQVVRRLILDQVTVGSNPTRAAKQDEQAFVHPGLVSRREELI